MKWNNNEIQAASGAGSNPTGISSWKANPVFIVLCLLCGPGLAAPRGEELLDFTSAEVEQVEPLPGGCGGGRLAGGTHDPGPRFPELNLSLTVEQLDSYVKQVGDKLVAELRFTNTGTKPKRFPLSWRWEKAFGENCRGFLLHPTATHLRGSLRLELQDEAGYTEPIAWLPLFASSSEPSTYRVLAPGESIRVKLAGKIHFWKVIENRKPDDAPFKLPQVFVVKAAFDLDDSSLWNPHERLRSANSIKLRVEEAE